MNLAEYGRLDGLGLVALVRRREVAPKELLDLARAAVDAVDPALNAVVGVTAEPHVPADVAERPMAGLPFLVKDLGIEIAGEPCEMGSRLLRGRVADRDSELALRYRAAGLVTFGRTNTPEFGLNPSTEPLLHGATRNPWDPGRSAGGSSGGAAAAVAAGIVPIAHGTDGGGSIRCPAAACGVFGLKPSRGRVPWGPALDEPAFGIVAQHVLTRSVRDSAAILDLSAGADPGARLVLPPPATTFLDAAGRDPRGLRIGVTTAPPAGGPVIAPECVAAVGAAARLCERLGHTIVEVALPVGAEEIASVFADLHAFSFAGDVPALERESGRSASETTIEWASWTALQHGRAMTAVDLAAAFALWNGIARRVGRLFATFDVLLSPVLAGAAVPLGTMNANDRSLSYLEMTAKFFAIMPFTPVFNLTGQPAMSLPLGQAADGMPVGVQFAGRLADEATLFSLAGQIERAAPWQARRPPIFVGRP